MIAALGPGQRTPLFTLGGYARYSWYVRLAAIAGGHSWSGVVRCEAANSLPLAQVVTIADRTAATPPGRRERAVTPTPVPRRTWSRSPGSNARSATGWATPS